MTIAVPADAWWRADRLGEGFHPHHAPLALIAGLPRPVLVCVARGHDDAGIKEFLRVPCKGSKVVIGTADLADAQSSAVFLPALERDLLAAAYCAADVAVVASETPDLADDLLAPLACGTPVAALPGEAALAVLGKAGRGQDDDFAMTVGAIDADLAVAVGKALRCDRMGTAVQGARLLDAVAAEASAWALAAA